MTKAIEEAGPAVGSVRTFLIADVRGYTRFTVEHGDEAAASLAARFAAIAREVAQAHGGQVIELRGDEALAVFLSARQALRAAVDLQGRLATETMGATNLPLKVGIGLDAGEAISVEGGYRGVALNLAARLCSLAGPGEVLASEGVVHLARKLDGMEYAERGAVQLKGFVDLVRVVQVVAEDADKRPDDMQETDTPRERPLPIGGFLGALPSGPLVARDAELHQVLSVIDAVAGGSGRLVFLRGEPGIGKTRLAQEVTLHLRNRSFLVASGRCYGEQEAIPFYPFLEALGTMYTAAPASIRADVGRRWPYLFRILPNVSRPSSVSSSEGKDEQERLFWAVTGFLRAIAEEVPLALLLDDLHWADSTSLALLQHLARHTRAYRVLLLGTYRDVEVGRQHPLERALRDLGREQLVEGVHIRRLEREGTAALIATTFGEDELSVEFSELVYQQTEGNPFFTQEVLRALVERGDIYRQDGRWERREVQEIEVPESIRSAIGERLSRLSEEAQAILCEASVFGQTFGFDQLQALGQRDEEEVEAALETATAAGLLRVAENDVYAFNHALTQQVIYTELSPRRRRRLHKAAGEALERLPQRTREERAAELAWHFLDGEDAERALSYAVLAGDRAEAVFAHAEAERHYRTGVQLAREMGNASAEAQALEKLGAMFAIVGRYDESLEVLEQAIPLYRATGNADAETRVLGHVGRVHWRRGTPQEGIARLEPIVEKLGPDVLSRGYAECYIALAHLFFASGKYREQLRAAEKASDLARLLGDDQLLGEAQLRRGNALLKLGRQDGLHVLERAVPLLEASGDLVNLAITFVNLAAAYDGSGEFDRCRRYLERAVELTRQTGDLAEMAFALAQIGEVMFTQGEWKQARTTVEEALAITRRTETFWKAAYPPLAMGEVCVAQGRWQEASAYLEECIAIANRSPDLQALRYAHGCLAERDLMNGQPEAAVARLEPLTGEEGEDVFRILPTLATAYVAIGDVARASQIATEAVEWARAQDVRPLLADALRAKALVLTQQKQWPDALETLEEGLSLTRAMRYPYAEARMLYAYGIMYAHKGEPKEERQRLEEALVIFRRLEARPYIERTEETLAELQ